MPDSSAASGWQRFMTNSWQPVHVAGHVSRFVVSSLVVAQQSGIVKLRQPAGAVWLRPLQHRLGSRRSEAERAHSSWSGIVSPPLPLSHSS